MAQWLGSVALVAVAAAWQRTPLIPVGLISCALCKGYFSMKHHLYLGFVSIFSITC